jgi:hypothetical protein
MYMQLLFNQTARKEWIEHTIGTINRLGADGINFDIEGNEGILNTTKHELTSFLTDLRAEGEKTNPHFQLSFESPVYMGQPICAHANDWAGMIKPNGPVRFAATDRVLLDPLSDRADTRVC